MILNEIWSGWTILSSLGTCLAAIVAVFYTIFTYRLLNRTNQTFHKTNSINEFLIYKEISDKFSNTLTVYLVDKCISGKFSIDYKNESDDEADLINSHTINRFLLNPIEDIAVFWEQGLISIKTIDSGFGYKILSIGNCSVINKHVADMRSTLPTVYNGFQKLYNAIHANATDAEKKNYNAIFIGA